MLGAMAAQFSPPYVPPDQLVRHLRERGYVVLQASDSAAWLGCSAQDLRALQPDWDDLPLDDYLRDGGRYRRRRHACFVAEDGELHQAKQRAHWQPLRYNALHGGIERWFAPMQARTLARPVWGRLLRALAATAQAVLAERPERWHLEAHQLRIDTAGGIGRPTPEGAHRDGVDLVAVFLVAREGVKGGETRIFETASPAGQRFTLEEPWSVLLLDDARMIHETTPIQPLEPGASGWRDTLVLTCRRGAFLGDEE